MKNIKQVLTVAFVLVVLLFCCVPESAAALYAAGPVDPAFGFFPIWYQDAHARPLELCLSQAVGPNGAMCILLPTPGVFDPTQPIIFPANFPDESFWFAADAIINNAATGLQASFRAALEAAFANGDVVNGEQISFARIRIRVTLPGTALPGSYTVTHPYGVEVFNVIAGGPKAINITRDVGVVPGGFTGALKGELGPFLTRAAGLITVGVETFIGDPNVTQTVTGSPFGTNLFRIQGPSTDVQTDQFTLAGKIRNEALPTPISLDRTTYGRTATASQTDVFAQSAPTASLSFSGAGSPTTIMGGDITTGRFFGQSTALPLPLNSISVTATNPSGTPPNLNSFATSTLIDVVSITQAEYSRSTRNLSITASSSDLTGNLTLTAEGLGLLNGSGSPQKTLTISLPIPPVKVKVNSSNLGSDTEEVVIVP